MKTLICLAAFVIAANAIDPEFIKQVKEHIKKELESCAKEVSAGPNDIADIYNRKIPDSHEGKCIFFCMHKHFNAQNEDGSLNMEGALDSLEMVKDVDAEVYEKIVAVFKNCESTPKDSDPCVFATSLVQCIIQKKHEQGLDDLDLE